MRQRPSPFGSRTSTAMPVSTFLPLASPGCSPPMRSHPPPPCRLVGRGPGAPDATECSMAPRSGRSRSRSGAPNPVARGQPQACTVSGVRVRSKIVPATELRPPHPEHLKRPSPSRQPPSWPQSAQAKPAGHRPLQVPEPHRCLELAHGPRIVRASTRVIHRLGLLSPVKWIPQMLAL